MRIGEEMREGGEGEGEEEVRIGEEMREGGERRERRR